MAALRFLAFLFIVVAIVALVSDLTVRGAAARPALFSSLAQHCNEFAPSALAGAQRLVRSGLHPLVWDLALRPLLAVPTSVAFAGAGLTFAYAGRRRRRVQIFTN